MSVYEPPVELLQKLNPLLQDELAVDNLDKLKEQLAKLDAMRYELSYTRCEWFRKLMRERERLRVPKDAQFTELDRKTMLDAHTSVVASDYEFLVSLEQIVKDKLELGITLLQTL